MESIQEVIHTINAVTATTVGEQISIQDAERVSFVFKRSNHSSGSTAFTVSVSADGLDVAAGDSTWVAYAKLIDNVTNSNAQTLTRVSTSTLSSNTSVTLSMDLTADAFTKIRVTATETTDGTHDAWVIIKYSC